MCNLNQRYSWCLGIVIDGNYAEQTCKVRENCKFYREDIFTAFKAEQLENDFLLNEPGRDCQWFLPKREVVKVDEEADPFAPFSA